MSSGIMCGTRWGGRLGVHPGWNVISLCGSTVVRGAGAAADIIYGVCTLRGGITSGGESLVKISVSCLSSAVCLSPNVVIGIVVVGLSTLWVRSAAACVAPSCEDSIGKVSVPEGNM